jgi:cytidylate kinase
MIIAIDGTAASGKGSLAKNLAKVLNIYHVDTGSFYRVLASLAIKLGIENSKELINLAKILSVKKIIEVRDAEGKNLKSSLISEKSSQIATDKNIRKVLIELQRKYVNQHIITHNGAVIDGRDIGSVVFPDANFKFYLDADIKIRAERRTQELIHLNYKVIYLDVLNDLISRDERDKKRAEGSLKKVKDAYYIDTGNKSEEFVLKKALKVIKNF